LGNAGVAAEFGGRASIVYDFTFQTGPNTWGAWCGPVAEGANGYCGQDTAHQADGVVTGHGTWVASIAGGTWTGVAKKVTLKMVKLGNTLDPFWGPDNGQPYDNWLSNVTATLNWMAQQDANHKNINVPRGTIANLSLTLNDKYCTTLPASTRIQPAWENAVKAAHAAGIIVVLAAGNDGCNTANYSPTNIPEAFVVGATSSEWFWNGKDARAYWGWTEEFGTAQSRTGTNISAFAPSHGVRFMGIDGQPNDGGVGTSLATPYVAGTFAVYCQAAGTFCNTAATATIYQALRNHTVNTVVNSDGTAFTDGTPPRFIRQKW
jgi:hypothetical protein